MSLNTPQPTNTPSEQVGQGGITETPLPTATEENNIPAIPTENVTDNDSLATEEKLPEVDADGNLIPPVETPPVAPEDANKPATLSAEEMQSKLKEYELKEQEALDLKARLGIQNANPDNLHLDTIEATIDNKAQREWINLCNQYGVDYTPEGIDKTQGELLEKDPKAYYEFKDKSKNLYNSILAEKNEIKAVRFNHEITNFVEQNKPILENSPVVSQLIGNYLQNNANNLSSPSAELGGMMEAIKMIYAEAVEVGKQVALLDSVAKDKSGIASGNSIATANTSNYAMNDGTKIFTRAEIARMDTATFDKYEKVIQHQMLHGLIK